MKKIVLFLLLLSGSLSAENLSLEEKVGQLLIVHFHGEEANAEARFLIQEVHVGGIIYYNWANNLQSPEKIKAMSQGLQKLATIPLFIGIDQEGGKVNRLIDGFTHFPSQCAIARTGEPTLAYEVAFAIGSELRSVGINLNFAPVVDINSQPRNPIIGVRSFGTTADEVICYAEPTLDGYRASGILSCLKHFPGHGDVTTDSHETLPILSKNRYALEKNDLLPFLILGEHCDMIMTGHLLVPALDAQKCVTLSYAALNYLRQIGYQGVIISDSLVMEGICKDSIENTAIEAFNAGCDLLLLGGKQLHTADQYELCVDEVQKIHQALVNAVKNGQISSQRLDAAVNRILQLKRCLKSHQDLAEEVAYKSLKVVQRGNYTLEGKKVAVIAPAGLKGIPDNLPNYLPEEADILIFCSVNSWKNKEQQQLFYQLQKLDKPILLLVLEDPLDSTLFPEALLTMETCSSTEVSVRAAFEELWRRGTSLKISLRELEMVGDKIWKNECGGKEEKLMYWNPQEAFPSLGIGHFIWYPSGKQGPFEETFPQMIHFLQERGVEVPQAFTSSAPWTSREEFIQMPPEQKEPLCQFLLKTKTLQAAFIAHRLEKLLPQLLEGRSNAEKNQICHAFFALSKNPRGLFALLDYLHFKGSGINSSESYQGQGWGLVQVLLTIPLHSVDPLYDFKEGARKVLTRRVKNAPTEERWLPGWLNRIDSL